MKPLPRMLIGARWQHSARSICLTAGAVLFSALLLVSVSGFASLAADAQNENLVEQLQNRLNSGTEALAYDGTGHGYLPAVLDAFHIPVDSQLLVFSASSLQFDRINQKEPRALYYQDNIAVGAVQGGRFLEIIALDRQSGVAFYTLDVQKSAKPQFVRRSSECLGCHGFASKWAAGMMVASYDTGPGGQVLNLDPNHLFYLTDDRTPFEARYGGWYVTGKTGAMQHRGNVTFDPVRSWEVPPGGLNIASLADRIDIKNYLEPGSDVVSLLTLEHQAGFVNLVTRINAQYASFDKGIASARVPATAVDIDESIESLVSYMTFVDEVPLPSPVQGTSSFAETFSRLMPADSQGRNLRQFDLRTRLFRYPLSYMVYSQAFDNLEPRAKGRVLRRLYDVLRGADRSGPFAKLAERDGAAAIAILAATKSGLPDFWKPVDERSGVVARKGGKNG
ncbi:MAG: hypothetical protein H6924_04690 [Alphaproteobacteria bacterium]|nr:hypothetical protein [Alphaproteobacteria bacterium]